MVFFYVIPLAGHKILVEMLKAPSLVGVSKDYDARLYMQASFFSLKASISPQWIIPRVCLPSTLEGVSNRRLEIAAGWCWTILTAAMQQIGCMESWVIFDLPCWFCLGQRMVRLMAYIVWFMTICSCFCVSEYHVLLYHWITHQSGELNEVSDPWSVTWNLNMDPWVPEGNSFQESTCCGLVMIWFKPQDPPVDQLRKIF